MKKPDKPTMKLAIMAHCHQCLGYWSDGPDRDCRNVKCPLYPFMPYRKMEPDLEWLEYNPKRVGKVKYEDCEGKPMSEEHKKAVLKGLKKAHEARKKNKEKNDD